MRFPLPAKTAISNTYLSWQSTVPSIVATANAGNRVKITRVPVTRGAPRTTRAWSPWSVREHSSHENEMQHTISSVNPFRSVFPPRVLFRVGFPGDPFPETAHPAVQQSMFVCLHFTALRSIGREGRAICWPLNTWLECPRNQEEAHRRIMTWLWVQVV